MKHGGGLPRTSVRTRILRAALVQSICVLVLAGLAAYFLTRQTLRRNLDQMLLGIASTETHWALNSPPERIHLHDTTLPLLMKAGGGYEKVARITDTSGRVLASTRNLPGTARIRGGEAAEVAAKSGSVAYADIRHDGTTLRAVYYPIRDAAGHRLIAMVALSDAAERRLLRSLAVALSLAVLCGSLLATLGALYLANRLTRSLDRIALMARAIRPDSMSQRVPCDCTERELAVVCGVLNDMLERLETALHARDRVIAAQRRFLADASHELRSPLSNLLGTLEVTLRRPRTTAQYRETLNASLVETRRMCRLVDDLLTLSRADSGHFVCHFAPCDVAAVVRESAAAHEAMAERAGVALCMDADEAAPLCADADRLRQAVDNLVDNALRCAPPGTAVRLRAAADNGRVEVSVRDAGPGLPPDEQVHVFERFYRTDAGRDRDSGGMGLGLSIVRAIAEAHGGTAEVDSTPGHGATFRLLLPRHPPAS